MEMQDTSNFEAASPGKNPPAFGNIFIGIILGGVLTLLCFACIGAGLVANSMNLADDCKQRGPSWVDDFNVQTYSKGVFKRDIWKETFTNSPDRATMTWTSDSLNAVAYLDNTVYECGFGSTYLEDNFNDSNFKTVIYNTYQNVERVSECSKDDLHLYIYTGQYKGTDYEMYFWTQANGKTRWLSFSMAFPTSNQAQLKDYAEKMHPELSSCG